MTNRRKDQPEPEPEGEATFTVDDLPGGMAQPEAEATLDVDEEQFARSMAQITQSILQAKRGQLNQKKAEEALGSLKEALAGLDDSALRQVMANADLQDVISSVSRVSGTEPGQPIYDEKGREIGSVPYSYDDFCRIYPMHTWISPRNDVVSVNGVSVRLIEGLEFTAPKVFFDIQQESINRERYARNEQARVLQAAGAADGTTLEVGWAKTPNDQITESTPGWHNV